PKQFSREQTLRTVTKFVACDDQAFEVANKPSFRNCLTSMRPQTIKADLPSAHDVKTCLQNECVDYLNKLKAKITVSHLVTPDNLDNSLFKPHRVSLVKSQ
ncbi:hypothetical protein F5887DRAFT_891161, partial [Amanita rubescens]